MSRASLGAVHAWLVKGPSERVDGCRGWGGARLGGWAVGRPWEAVGFVSTTICGMGECRCAREGEGQVGHLNHPMGLGDKFCAHYIQHI